MEPSSGHVAEGAYSRRMYGYAPRLTVDSTVAVVCTLEDQRAHACREDGHDQQGGRPTLCDGARAAIARACGLRL